MSGTTVWWFFNFVWHRFQWAALQIHQLFAITLAVDIEKTLGKLPETLEQTYDQIWTTIRDGGQFAYQLVTRALMWVLCSMRPLKMEEWAKASYPPADYPRDGTGATTLLGLCRNLVIWDDELYRMSFAHLSVQEYLEGKIFDVIQAHSMAAQSCLSYLTYPKHALNDRRSLGSVLKRTFENYALMWWGYHFERAFNRERRMSDQAREQLQEFLGTSTKPGRNYCKWLETLAVICTGFRSGTHLDTKCYYLRSIPPNPLFAMSFYNFGGELEQHWELNPFNANCRNLAREPLLQIAIMRGNEWVVKYLCSKGADVNAIINRRSLLMLAIDSDRAAAFCSLVDWGAKIAPLDGVYSSLLHAAASRGGARVVEAVLARCVDISEAVVLAAAKNERHGAEIIKLLFTRDAKIETTGAVVVAALANKASGPELMELLFDRDPSLNVPDEAVVAALSRYNMGVVEVVLSRSPDISEVVLVAVAEQSGGPELIMKLLLTSHAEIQITQAVVVALMGNRKTAPELMGLLFDRYPTLQVPDVAVVAALKRAKFEAVGTVLDRSPNLSETVLVALAEQSGGPELIMKLLLTSHAEIQITQAVVVALMGNRTTAPELMGLLFDRYPTLQVPEAAVVAASRSTNGLKLIQPLLDRGAILATESLLIAACSVREYDPKFLGLLLTRGREIKTTEVALLEAVSNEENNKRALRPLLWRNPDLRITEAILMAAVATALPETIEMLVARAPKAIITGATLAAATSNRIGSTKIVELLLARNPDIKITEAILKAVVAQGERWTVELLMAHDFDIEITGAVLEAAARDAEVLKLLLSRNPDIEITEAIFTTVASNPRSGPEIVELLLAKIPNITTIKARLMAAAASNTLNGAAIMELLLPGNPDIEISEAILTAALTNEGNGVKILELLLARYPNTRISETELLVAVKRNSRPEPVVGFLLDRDATLKATEALVVAAVEHNFCRVELVELLLARGGDLGTSEAIATAAVNRAEQLRGDWRIIELLLKHNGITQLPRVAKIDPLYGNPSGELLPLPQASNPEIKITSALLVKAAKAAWGEASMQLLLAVGGATKITEAVLVAAAANETKGREGPGVAVALMELLLARNTSLQITDAVVVAAAGSSRAVEVLEDLWARDNTLRVTEAVVVAAAANTSCGPEVIRLLLARDGDLEVTKRVTVAAAANGRLGPQVMELLLTRDATINVTEEIMVAAVANRDCGWEVTRLLVARNENIEITEKILMALARSGDDRTMACLLDINPSIEYTDAIDKAIEESLRGIEPSYERRYAIRLVFRRRDSARDSGSPLIQPRRPYYLS